MKKNVMANEISSICRSEFYYLVFLSELIVTCLIGFHRFVMNFNGNGRKGTIIFNV